MDKRRAIQIMTNAAKLYRDNLEDQKLMFLYGIPAEVKRKAQTEGGCIGFVRDKNTMLNVPNTLLKKDIRDVTEQPTMKIYAVLSKGYTEEKYSVWEKTDKEINLRNYCLAESIETRIARKKGGKTKEIDMEKRTK